MSLRRFIVYFCAVAALCVFAFGHWVPQMPASSGFPIDLQGHTAPIDPVTGQIVMPPDELTLPPAPEAAAVWANVSRQRVAVAALPR